MTLFKKCRACGAEVPEDVKIPCPKCGESKGFVIIREVQESVSVKDFVNAEKKAASEIKVKFSNLFKKQFEKTSKKKQREYLETIKKIIDIKQEEYLKKAEEKGKEKYKEARNKGETKKSTFTFGGIIGTEDQRKIKELEDALDVQKKKNIELQAKCETENDIYKEALDELLNKASTIESHTEGIPNVQEATERLENASTRAEKVTYASLAITIGALILTAISWNISFN